MPTDVSLKLSKALADIRNSFISSKILLLLNSLFKFRNKSFSTFPNNSNIFKQLSIFFTVNEALIFKFVVMYS